MNDGDFLAGRFEEHRPRLKSVAYRMLGSLAEAEDAVQEAWLRLARADGEDIGNLGGWLTTVVSRVCLDMLRSRASRREEPLEDRLPDPVVLRDDSAGPEEQALAADAVGLALLVVLESLSPAERLAFVLHDLFGLPFDEIAPILDRSPAAARQLASRGRRRVRGAAPAPDSGLAAQRRVVDAFLAAAGSGDLEGLLAVLDPDMVLRAESGPGPVRTIRGARRVAGQAMAFHRFTRTHDARPALVNGAAGLVDLVDGRPRAVLGFTIVDGRIAELDIIADPEHLARIDLSDFTG
ncbi:sigma-70 family RNA polymerase sigma factor [Nocardiopsis potens]|uniref:sigma-70 family RNA polymerase sigma factor n=1 Tax=Nocardiopsis potens TaxID=1246458 RepID=UPI000345EC31|nr:sigma-70 family RNA polymerase sigma factor [Nocardiopsis potens]